MTYQFLKGSDPSEFYVTLKDADPTTIHREINEYLTNRSLPVSTDASLVNQVIAVNLDGRWARAKVLNIIHTASNVKLKCFLVDSAEFVCVCQENCQKISSRLRNLPFAAIACKLDGIAPLGLAFRQSTISFQIGVVGAWSEVAKDFFRRYMEGDLTVEFSTGRVSQKGFNAVSVFTAEGDNVADMLCQHGFATRELPATDSAITEDDDLDSTVDDDPEEPELDTQFVFAENCLPEPLETVDELVTSAGIKTRLHLFPKDEVLLHCWGKLQSNSEQDFVFVFPNQVEFDFSGIRAALTVFPLEIQRQANSAIVLPSGDEVYEVLSRLCDTSLSRECDEAADALNCLGLDSVIDLKGIAKDIGLVGAGGKETAVLSGSGCILLTPSVLLAILKDLKIEMDRVLFVDFDRYSEQSLNTLECYFSTLKEYVKRYNFALRKRPQFVFHINEWGPSARWIENLAFPSCKPTGWLFFSALSVCHKTARIPVTVHRTNYEGQTCPRDDCLLQTLTFSMIDNSSRTLVVCSNDISRNHVHTILSHNLGGLFHVEVVNVRTTNFNGFRDRTHVLVFYDVSRQRDVDKVISACGFSELRRVHVFEEDFEAALQTTCQRIIYFGRCDRVACKQNMLSDPVSFPNGRAPSSDGKIQSLASLLHEYPDDRQVSLRVRSVVDPSRFYAWLLSHHRSGTVFETAQTLLDMDLYFSGEQSPKSITVAEASRSDCRVYAWKDHGCIYRRVRLELEDNGRNRLFLLDTGLCQYVNANERLYELKEEFRSCPPAVIECINCSIKPADGDDYWPVLSRKFADQILRGKVIHADVVLVAGERIWLEKVNEPMNLDNLGISLRDQTFKCRMITSGLAVANSEHLPSLANMLGVTLPQSRVALKPAASAPAAIPIPDETVVDVRNWDGNGIVYVQRKDMKKQLDELNRDVNNVAKISQHAASPLRRGDCCLIKISAGPVESQSWYRAEQMENDKYYLVDYGIFVSDAEEVKLFDGDLVPIAALCKPISLRCYDWSADCVAVHFPDDVDYQLLVFENGCVRLLSLAMETEPVDVCLVIPGLWPRRELVECYCKDIDKCLGPFTDLLSSPEKLCNTATWKLLCDLWSALPLAPRAEALRLISFATVLTWKYDKQVSHYLLHQCVARLFKEGDPCSIELAVSHALRVTVTESDPEHKKTAARFLCQLRPGCLASKDLLRPDRSRIVSIFRAALGLADCDSEYSQSLLKAVPPASEETMLTFDQLDEMRRHLNAARLSKERAPPFLQLLYRFESLLEDEPKQEKQRLDLLSSNESSDDLHSDYSSDDSSISAEFTAGVYEVLKKAVELYNSSNDIKEIRADVDAGSPRYLYPTVSWFQTKEEIFLRVNTPGRASIIHAGSDIAVRILNSRPALYGFDLRLYSQVKEASHVEKATETTIRLRKLEAAMWPRLQHDDRRPHFLHYDTSKLCVSDEDSHSEGRGNGGNDYDDSDEYSTASSDVGCSHYNEKEALFDDEV